MCTGVQNIIVCFEITFFALYITDRTIPVSVRIPACVRECTTAHARSTPEVLTSLAPPAEGTHCAPPALPKPVAYVTQSGVLVTFASRNPDEYECV